MTEEELDAMWEKQMQEEKAEKVKKYSILNTLARKGQTVLAGSSLMEFFPVNELQQTLEKQTVIYNRGLRAM